MLVYVLAQDGFWNHMRGWGGGWMWLWGSLMMLSWVAIVAAAAWLVIRAARSDGGTSRDAKKLLDERLARGEISLDEYRRRREAMR